MGRLRAASASGFAAPSVRDVEEYCVSEGWIRAPVGKTRDRKGHPLLIKLTGTVEPYFLAPSAAAPPAADGN